MNQYYLEKLRIKNYGAFSNKTVGPFSPNMTVVYGANERGKTTVSSFIGDVIFGWQRNRAGHNSYKSDNGDRAGSLFFSPRNNENGSFCTTEELSRTVNAEGLKGNTDIVSDIDKDTFNSIFSIDSKELYSLSNAGETTAHLLTAGSGTQTSPAYALEEIKDRIKSYSSSAQSNTHSIVNLTEEYNRLSVELERADNRETLLRDQDARFASLESELQQLKDKNNKLEVQKSQLFDWRDKANQIETKQHELQESLINIDSKISTISNEINRLKNNTEYAFISANSQNLGVLETYIHECQKKQSKIESELDIARSEYITAKARFASFQAEPEAESRPTSKGARTQKIGIAIFLMILAVVISFLGLSSEAHLVEIASVGSGVLLWLVSLYLLLSLDKPNKVVSGNYSEGQQAQIRYQEAKSKYEAAQQVADNWEEKIQKDLEVKGFGAASITLQSASEMIEHAIVVQRSIDESIARLNEAKTQKKNFLDNIDLCSQRSAQVAAEMKKEKLPDSTWFSLAISKVQEKQDAIYDLRDKAHAEFGQLKNELSTARENYDFNRLKLEKQEIKTRIEDSSEQLAILLVAEEILQSSIKEWERKSQPEVYKQASELLSLMTDGAWIRVDYDSNGEFKVTNAFGEVFAPELLSLGTRQQLYLSLRLALLMKATNTGRSIPIIADDILVHFDNDRRINAARALTMAARTRQIIFFTCHKEVVEVLRSVNPQIKQVNL